MAESQAEKTAEKPFKRLPVDVLPRNYRLELKPDLTAFTFQGSLEITTEVEGERERGKENGEEKTHPDLLHVHIHVLQTVVYMYIFYIFF